MRIEIEGATLEALTANVVALARRLDPIAVEAAPSQVTVPIISEATVQRLLTEARELNKIGMIKVVRELTGASLKRAKDIVESVYPYEGPR